MVRVQGRLSNVRKSSGCMVKTVSHSLSEYIDGIMIRYVEAGESMREIELHKHILKNMC